MRTGYDRYGRPIVAEPVEIDCRWVRQYGVVETSSSDQTARHGTTEILATVVVDREITVGSGMWKGSLDSWYGVGSANNNSDVLEVAAYIEADDVRGRETYRAVKLTLSGDAPPNRS